MIWERKTQVQVPNRHLRIFPTFSQLNACLIECHRCPRLVRHREGVPEKRRFQGLPHWRRPVPGFGDKRAWLMILGLAPSSQGGNRTGRIFTGDPSAQFLFEALHRAGFAKFPFSESARDGQQLQGCYVTAAVKCVPPKNLPTAKEKHNCSSYLQNELHLLKGITAVLVLGGFALDAYLLYVKERGGDVRGVRFQHGKRAPLAGFPTLYMCYHPSPQNTQTGRLTMQKMLAIIRQMRYDKNRQKDLG